jgi:hypothetical protein
MLAPNGVSSSRPITTLTEALDWTIALLSRYFDTDGVIVDGAVSLSRWKSWFDQRASAQMCCFNPECKTAPDTNLSTDEASLVDNFMGRHFTCAKFFQGSHQAITTTSNERLALESFYPPLLICLGYQLKQLGFSDTGGAIVRLDGTLSYKQLFQFGGPWGAIQAALVWQPQKVAH